MTTLIRLTIEQEPSGTWRVVHEYGDINSEYYGGFKTFREALGGVVDTFSDTGIPLRCDFCGQKTPPSAMLPEESDMWACSQCADRWRKEDRMWLVWSRRIAEWATPCAVTDGFGATKDRAKAHRFTYDEALRICQSSGDVPEFCMVPE